MSAYLFLVDAIIFEVVGKIATQIQNLLKTPT